MALYKDQFSPQFDFADAALPTRTLVIASTPRCGSHFLGHALQATGLFGSPFEYANPVNLARWKVETGQATLAGVLQVLMRRRTSPNGIFSIKVHQTHLRQFGNFGGLLAELPDVRILHLKRQDMLGQAVSFAMAMQTGVWISGQEGNGRTPEYDFVHIYRCLELLIDQNAKWQMLIATSGRPAMAMHFEDARANLAWSLAQTGDLMGVETDQKEITERTERQADSRNREWSERFLDDYATGRFAMTRRWIDLRRCASRAMQTLRID